eukprot:5044494-Amphidinium_carterae.1
MASMSCFANLAVLVHPLEVVGSAVVKWYGFITLDNAIIDVLECSGLGSRESDLLVKWSCKCRTVGSGRSSKRRTLEE